MTIMELINRLVQLPYGFGNYQIKVHIGYSTQNIKSITIDHLEGRDPEVWIELE